MKRLLNLLILSAVVVLFSGCVALPPARDYTEFRRLQPKSILVLPPISYDSDERASYSYLSTLSRPLAERGYYVFPVAVIDQFLKENGMKTASEMHRIPLATIDEVIGADAVLYIDLEYYGTDFAVLASYTTVAVSARLVDVKTGRELWSGSKMLSVSSTEYVNNDPFAMLICAAVTHIIDYATDRPHRVSRMLNGQLISEPGQGLLYGPRHVLFGTDGLPEEPSRN